MIRHDWHTITMLSPCWRSILLTTTRHVWYCFHVCVSHLKNIHTIVSSLQHLLGIPSPQQLAFSLYQGGFVSWGLQEQELLRQQQRQCQSLARMRKGVSQQQEHVNGVNANQRSKWNTADQSDGACRRVRMSVRGATKWDRQTDLTGHAACRGACMSVSVREATKRKTADWLDVACRGTRMSVSGVMKWNTADQLDGACRGARTSVRGATCREWRTSS
jgi:hypothetical protein